MEPPGGGGRLAKTLPALGRGGDRWTQLGRGQGRIAARDDLPRLCDRHGNYSVIAALNTLGCRSSGTSFLPGIIDEPILCEGTTPDDHPKTLTDRARANWRWRAGCLQRDQRPTKSAQGLPSMLTSGLPIQGASSDNPKPDLGMFTTTIAADTMAMVALILLGVHYPGSFAIRRSILRCLCGTLD